MKLFEWLLKCITFGWYMPGMEYRAKKVYGSFTFYWNRDPPADFEKWKKSFNKKFGGSMDGFFRPTKKEEVEKWLEKNPVPQDIELIAESWPVVSWYIPHTDRFISSSGDGVWHCNECEAAVRYGKGKSWARCPRHPSARIFFQKAIKNPIRPWSFMRVGQRKSESTASSPRW